MVGRERELAALDGALDRAIAGSGGTVVIGGEAGIGKTRLVAAFAEHAMARGATVLSGVCLPDPAGTIPYGPFVEALRTWVRATDPGALAGLLGAARAEIGRLLPDVASSAARGTDPDDPDDRGGQARLFEALLGLFERQAARAPIVLVVEDVQWADDGTAALLTFLSRALRRDPVLLIVTARIEDLDAAAGGWLAELERDAWVDRLQVAPLDRGQVAAFLKADGGAAPPPESIDALATRSGGNPFFLEQLAAAPTVDRPSDLPPRLRDVLVARLADLPEATRSILRAAAASGRRVDDRVLSVVLGISPSAVADALRPALVQGILDEVVDADGQAAYTFHHALLAEVAEHELLHGERDRLHAAFATELERRADIDGSTVAPAELAFHWVAAHDRERAVPALIDAGLAAERVFAFADARRRYDEALDLWPDGASAVDGAGMDRVAVLQRAAESGVLSGSYAEAVARGRQAIVAEELAEVVRGREDHVRLGALHERLRWYLWEAGDRAAAEAAVDHALQLIPAEPPTALRARALAQAAGARLFGGSPTAAATLAREAIDVARRVPALSEEALALGVLGWATAVTGDVDAGIATYREGLAIAERLGGVEGIALGHANLAALLDRVGRSEASLAAARTGFEITQRLGVVRTYGGGLAGHAAKALFDLGRWNEAIGAAEDGLALDPVGSAAILLHLVRARVATNRGDFDDAERHLGIAGSIDGGPDDQRWSLAAARAELDAWRHRPEPIRNAVREALARDAGVAPPDPSLGWLAWHALRAEADAAVEARARHDVSALSEIEDRVNVVVERVRAQAPGSIDGPIDARRAAVVGLCLGELARAQGRRDIDGWTGTAAAWEAIGRPMLVAYSTFRVAEARLGQQGDRVERAAAADALRSAHAIARGLGAAPLLDAIERLARHARIDVSSRVDVVTPSDPLGLTDREAEVLRLVAAGRSNQQIADTLFITRKTASVHVSNILGKLGVSNRVEAAAVAQRLGLDEDVR